MLITYTAVQQQDGHVDDVEVGQQVPVTACHTVRQRTQQVTCVVKMTCSAPETRRQQLALMNAAVRRAIRALDEGRLAAPDFALALRAPEQVLLVVGRAEDIVAHQAEGEDGPGVRCGELDRVVDQVQALEREKCEGYSVFIPFVTSVYNRDTDIFTVRAH